MVGRAITNGAFQSIRGGRSKKVEEEEEEEKEEEKEEAFKVKGTKKPSDTR